MAVFVERPASPALWNLCAQISFQLRPGSRAVNSFRKDLRQIAIDDHTDMLLRGVDRYGKTRAPLAKRTIDDPRRGGTGPSLIPRGMGSRFITNFEATWVDEQGVMFLVCRYRDILSKPTRRRGPQSFAQFHMTGATKPGTRWVLPRRDTGGITPKGWPMVRARLKQLAEDVVRMGGGTLR